MTFNIIPKSLRRTNYRHLTTNQTSYGRIIDHTSLSKGVLKEAGYKKPLTNLSLQLFPWFTPLLKYVSYICLYYIHHKLDPSLI